MIKVLASASPRRRAFIEAARWEYDIFPVDHEEIFDDAEPILSTMTVAFHKAYLASEKYGKKGLFLGCDTTVIGQRVYQKPQDREDARRMLIELSGITHSVVSGFALIDTVNARSYVDYDLSLVRFLPYESYRVMYEEYLLTDEWEDKAGAYGIQSPNVHFIDSYSGSLSNIIGLPMEKLREYLDEKGELRQPTT